MSIASVRRPSSALRRLLRACAALGLAVLPAAPGGSSTSITNAGTVIAQNEANVAQPPVVATVVFTAKANPVLAVVKTSNLAAGAPGQLVEYALALTYPQIGGVCGDDSSAVGVTLTDTIPAGMTYVANSSSVSVDNGTTFGLGTDAVDGTDVAGIAAVSFVSGQVRVTFLNAIPECAAGATTRIVKFTVTVN